MVLVRLALLLILASTLVAPPAVAQTSKVFDDLSLDSKILKAQRKYAVYLPPDYETSSRSYPVLYLLHGRGDDQSGWVQFGEVRHIADKAIRAGKATPMVIVMPSANETHKGYTNHITEDFRYEDFFFDELMPHVEKKYRIRAQKRYRAVAGLSMGGGGTLIYALHRPDLFSSACPLSPYAGPFDKESLARDLGRRKANATQQQIDDYYNKYAILKLIEKMPARQKRSVRWYIDCGDDDFLYESASRVHIAMRKNQIPHEYRVRDGGHSWTYWRASLPKVLEFASQSFHQH